MANTPDICSVIAACVTPQATIELRDYDFPNPNHIVLRQDRPVLSLATPRADRASSHVWFMGERPYSEIGPIMLRPPGIPLHAFGLGGRSRQLLCEYDNATFEEITGLHDWDRDRLRRCVDINSATIYRTMRRLSQEIANPGFGNELIAQLLSQTLLIDLARVFRANVDADRWRRKGGLAGWQLRRIDELLYSSVGEWATVNKLADACGISRFHLSRSFRQATGRTLVEHSTKIRMSRAEALLAQNDMSVRDVARHLGFRSANSFSTSFRRESGMSPTEFVSSKSQRSST